MVEEFSYTELMYQLAQNAIPFSVHFSGQENEYFVVTVEAELKADQLRELTELGANFVGGKFHIMGDLNE